MARNKGTFTFAANLEVKSAAALDPRCVVDTKAELISKETWPYDGDTLYVYNGMQVGVVGEKSIYMLTDATKILESDYSGWKRMDASETKAVEVIDNLTTANPDAALSANQGKVLSDKVDELTTKLTAIFNLKGTKNTLDEIKAVDSPAVGDVYHNVEDGGEYVYTESGWELLGISVDLSAYAKTEDVNTSIETAKTELNATITSLQTDLEGKITNKVDKADGKSLVDDTLIDQITQNKTDIEALKTDFKVKDVDTTASNGINLTLSEAGVVGISAANISVPDTNVKYTGDDVHGYVEMLNGQTLSNILSKINPGISEASLGAYREAALNLTAGNNAISFSEVTPGHYPDDDTTKDYIIKAQTVSLKIADNTNLSIGDNGLELVWME